MPSYGRGGAGNIKAVQQEAARVAEDLEANRASSIVEHPQDQLPGDYLLHSGQPLAHTGRGGMGNVVDPLELKHSQSLTPTASQTSERRTSSTGAAAQAPGRGGAGNHEFSAAVRKDEAEKQTADEWLRRKKVEEDVESGVKQHLARPTKALLKTGRLH